jgi:predicted ATPase
LREHDADPFEEECLILRRWSEAVRGRGRVVVLMGEPGIGKSRLSLAVKERLGNDATNILSFHGSPYHQDSALHPFTSHLLRASSIAADDSAESKIAKISSLIVGSNGNIKNDLPWLSSLLSVPNGERCPLPSFTPLRIKERTLSALFDYVRHHCSRQPVLMLFEDLHWIDATSLELLSRIVEQAPALRLAYSGNGTTGILCALAEPSSHLPHHAAPPRPRRGANPCRRGDRR